MSATMLLSVTSQDAAVGGNFTGNAFYLGRKKVRRSCASFSGATDLLCGNNGRSTEAMPFRRTPSFQNNVDRLCGRFPEVHHGLISSLLESASNDIGKATCLIQQVSETESTKLPVGKKRNREWNEQMMIDDDRASPAQYEECSDVKSTSSRKISSDDFSSRFGEDDDYEEDRRLTSEDLYVISNSSSKALLSSQPAVVSRPVLKSIDGPNCHDESSFSNVNQNNNTNTPIDSSHQNDNKHSLKSSLSPSCSNSLLEKSSLSLPNINTAATTHHPPTTLSVDDNTNSGSQSSCSEQCLNRTSVALSSSSGVALNNNDHSQTNGMRNNMKLLSRVVLSQYEKLTTIQNAHAQLQEEHKRLLQELNTTKQELQQCKEANNALQFYLSASNQVQSSAGLHSLHGYDFNRDVF